jgi:hypothetical protein
MKDSPRLQKYESLCLYSALWGLEGSGCIYFSPRLVCQKNDGQVSSQIPVHALETTKGFWHSFLIEFLVV